MKPRAGKERHRGLVRAGPGGAEKVNRDLEGDFRNPGPWFRGQPFWAWNGDLDPQELRRQIRLMKRMGLGGFFMHSRVGLVTPYLKDEWFQCIEACADEAKKQDMLAWMYDEDRWPSGAAGGIVTKDRRWRRRSLGMAELTAPAALTWTAETVAAFTAKLTAGRGIPRSAHPAGKEARAAGAGRTHPRHARRPGRAQQLVQRWHLPGHAQPRRRAEVHRRHARGLPRARAPLLRHERPRHASPTSPTTATRSQETATPALPWIFPGREDSPRLSARATATTFSRTWWSSSTTWTDRR